jgi:hypothetical protein
MLAFAQAQNEMVVADSTKPRTLTLGRLPFDSTKAADECEGDRIRGLRQRHRRVDVDAGARDHRDALSIHPEAVS